MRFIQALSYSGANYLMKQKGENHEKRRVYFYGFQIVIGGIVKLILLFSLALLTNTIVPSFLMALAFASLRVIAGGYHMNTYGRCLAVSISMFIGFAVIARYTYSFWNIYYVIGFTIIASVFSAFSILKWAPADNPNRPINDIEEINKFKKLSIIYIVVWTAAAIIMIYFNLYMILLSIAFGVLLEIFSITPIGYRFFDSLKQGMDRIKK